MVSEDLREKMDAAFGNVATSVCQQYSGEGADVVDELLSTFFRFLRNRTDFYSNSDKSTPRQLVLEAFEKELKEYEKTRPKVVKKSRDEELRETARRNEEKKKREEMEWKERPKWSKGEQVKSSTTVEDLDEKKAVIEDTEKKGPRPVGNGGTTDLYTWSQELGSLEVRIPVKPGTRSRDLKVKLTKSKVDITRHDGEEILIAEWTNEVLADTAVWTLEDQNTLILTTEKLNQMKWWASAYKGHPEINTKDIVPDNSKLSDLDGETRQTVEKMMFDQNQKAQGLPTSDQRKNFDLIEKFKKQHPEMDFSQCKFN